MNMRLSASSTKIGIRRMPRVVTCTTPPAGATRSARPIARNRKAGRGRGLDGQGGRVRRGRGYVPGTPSLSRETSPFRVTKTTRSRFVSGRVCGRAQAELAGDRLERRDHVRDVLVELEAEELGAGVDLVPMDTRGK